MKTTLRLLCICCVYVCAASCGDNTPPPFQWGDLREEVHARGPVDPSAVENVESKLTSGTTYPSVGIATWTNPVPSNNRKWSTRAKVKLMRNPLNHIWTATRTDYTQGQFFSCTITLVDATGSFIPPLCNRCLQGQQTYMKQQGPASCTLQGVPFSFPETAVGPWRIFTATPYPSPDENMVGAEVIDLNVYDWHINAISYLDPGVNLRDLARQDKQIDAENIVWYQTWHMNARVPDTDWVTSERWNCGTVAAPGFLSGNLCLAGSASYAGPLDYIISTMWGSPQSEQGHPFSTGNPYTHELCHIKTAIETGSADPNHTGPCWTGPMLDQQAKFALYNAGF